MTADREELRRALEAVKAAILEADPNVLTCTLWMPERLSKNETVVDHIDAALTLHEGERKEITEEAYRRFPDDVEPVDYHPAGKIVVDRGNLRFAFMEGARFASSSAASPENAGA